jgi:hypothetical protein
MAHSLLTVITSRWVQIHSPTCYSKAREAGCTHQTMLCTGFASLR